MRPLDLIIREGLVALSQLIGRDYDPTLVSLWEKALKDLPVNVLEPAFVELGKTFKPTAACVFPMPAHLLELVKSVASNGMALKAEEAWQKLLDWVRLHFHPDLGIDRWAPQLDPAVCHAAKAAGGFSRIWGCADADLVWCKKAFIEDFNTVHETEQAEFLLTDTEAKKILARIRNGEAKALPPSSPDWKDLHEQGREYCAEKPQNPPTAPKPRFTPQPMLRSIEEQLAELRRRGFLK